MDASDNKSIAIIGVGYVGLTLEVEFGKDRQVGLTLGQDGIDEAAAPPGHTAPVPAARRNPARQCRIVLQDCSSNSAG